MRPLEKHGIPSISSNRAGYGFVAIVFIVFLQAGLWASHATYEPTPAGSGTSSSGVLPFIANSHVKPSVIKSHPIPKLMAGAESDYKKKLGRQSQTLKLAVNEYVRRYHRNPPKGFDQWWKFAQENNFKMVDEFDGLVNDLEPFWEISGLELRRRAGQAGYLPSMDLVQIRSGEVEVLHVSDGVRTSHVSSRATGFKAMIEKFAHLLPDMTFPINAQAEGRVLVPWEHRNYPNLTQQDSSEGLDKMVGGSFSASWDAQGSVWDSWRRTCAPSSAARRLFSGIRHSSIPSMKSKLPSDGSHEKSEAGGDFVFARDTTAHLDFCSKPYGRYMQGHFFSDFRTVPALYPVFSPAKARGFSDIRIPSHYYYGNTARYTYGWDPINLELNAVDPMEVAWEDKIDQVFWRGGSTGGGNHPPGFSQQYQRHRLLRMAADESSANRTVVFADPPSSTTHFVSADVSVSRLNHDILDVAFVTEAGANAYPGGLKALQRDHQFGDAVPLGRHWSYKYVLDLDGMGYSGRFLAFLASDSAVVKSTVYEEYFSDWMQPWLHFIPLSSSYREIYNIYSFFSGPSSSTAKLSNSTDSRVPEDGDRRLRRIARAGKQWKKTMGRQIDMEVYVYRLCLEYARLWANDRDSMDFKL